MSSLCTQNSLLLTNLLKFYNKDDNMERILPIINGESMVSLRLIDWFATNYSKKHNTVFIIYKGEDGNKTLKENDDIFSQFNVYNSYKSQLKAYSKKRFDPFCRREPVKSILPLTLTLPLKVAPPVGNATDPDSATFVT